MPFPNYDHFWGEDYNSRFDLYNNNSSKVFIMTSRSCPYRCTFCGVDAIWTRRYNMTLAKKIVEEIDHYVDKYILMVFILEKIYLRQIIIDLERFVTS